VTLALIVTLGIMVRDRSGNHGSALTISVLSSRPDFVSGGDARIAVTAPSGVSPSRMRVYLNDDDVTSQLTLTDAGREGVLGGLLTGPNQLRTTAPGTADDTVTLTNHPISGPVFSGAQQQPFVCQSEQFRTRTGPRLGPALDRDCTIQTSLSYVYLSRTTSAFRPLAAAAAHDPRRQPADIASVKNQRGVLQPFVVRMETASIDRGIAQIAVLDDPANTQESVASWNRKLIYAFGGSCGSGYRQGTRAVGVLSPNLLSQGYAVASNSLNAFEQNCNDVVASEAFAMTREHFIKEYGSPVYTMGVGCAGGAAQAYQTADNYPGLLDGIVVGCSVADLGFDLGQLVFDARLLTDYARQFPASLTAAQLQAVSGLDSVGSLTAMSNRAGLLDPTTGFDPAVPAGLRFDPAKNLNGARATIWDQTADVYGTSGAANRARRPLDNVGVQYGLLALEQGTITIDQFLDLNERIGGLGIDLQRTAYRTVADSAATRLAYSTGRLLNGGGGLSEIPIIDYRSYGYQPATSPVDMGYHSFAIRSRLIRANGDADNQVMLADSGHGRFILERGVVADAITSMDQWITGMKLLSYKGHKAAVDSRPVDLTDACFKPDGTKIVERLTYQGDGACSTLYPAYASPRMVAGGPLTGDVIACQRVPVDLAGYGRPLSPAQAARLERIFPKGVCDFDRGGQWQRPLSDTWQSY
jgi:hypothetical protein